MNRGGFSWKRLSGLSALKSKVSRSTGIPMTSSGRQRKLGKAVGCSVLPCLLVVLVAMLIRLMG
jgi:hypothetical protein